MDGGNDFENAIVFRGKPLTSILLAIFFFFWTVLFAYAMIFFTDVSKYLQAVHVIGLLLFLVLDVYAIRSIYRGCCVMVAIGERGMFDW